MKHIIDMNVADSVNFNKLLFNYQDILIKTRFEWEILNHTCRYNYGPGTMILECQLKKGATFCVHVTEEGSALLARQTIPHFDMEFHFENGKVHLTKHPTDFKIQQWLFHANSKRSTADEIGYVIVHSFVALNSLNPIFIKSMKGDTITYRFPPNFMRIAEDYLNAVQSKHRLDGWDVVNLTEKQYNKVIDILTDRGIVYDIDNIPLHRFCLSIFDGKHMHYYFFEQKGRDIHCGYTNDENRITIWCDISILELMENGDIHVVLHDQEKVHEWFTTTEPENENRQNWEWLANAFMLVNAFMLHYGDVSMEVEEKKAVAPSEPKAQKHRHDKRNSVRIFKSYHLVKNWSTKARKKPEFTCSAWGVRGHFRHYRNGKVVFVEAYVKGPEKANYKGKDYNLLPYKDA